MPDFRITPARPDEAEGPAGRIARWVEGWLAGAATLDTPAPVYRPGSVEWLQWADGFRAGRCTLVARRLRAPR